MHGDREAAPEVWVLDHVDADVGARISELNLKVCVLGVFGGDVGVCGREGRKDDGSEAGAVLFETGARVEV